jgi:hypothetical protein
VGDEQARALIVRLASADVAMSTPRIVHVMGWSSQQYGSFERFLVALARHCVEVGAVLHLVFHEPPASRRFVGDVEAEIHVVPEARSPGS